MTREELVSRIAFAIAKRIHGVFTKTEVDALRPHAEVALAEIEDAMGKAIERGP